MAQAPPLLLLQDIALTFGGTPLLAGASLSVGAGERLALVGRNGCGKSIVMKIAAGIIEPDAGRRFIQPGATIRYLPQEPDLSEFSSTLQYVVAGLGGDGDLHRARYLLQQLGLDGDEQPARLSGGEARRAALARALAPMPDILLLDEPTNHLDLPAIAWLETELAALRAALVLISHDRRFLETLSRAVVWLDRGVTRRLDRGFSAFEAWRDEVLDDESKNAHKLDRLIAREEDWLRYGVTARRKRNEGRLARLNDLREARRQRVSAPESARMATAQGTMSGNLVIAAEGIGKRYDGVPIVSDFSARILRGERVGIVGPNGAGKTTLLRLLTGDLPSDTGTISHGANLVAMSIDQRRESLEPTASLADTLTGGTGDMVTVGNQSRHVYGYMKDFLFAPEQARTPVGSLSGGERGRLLLARALARPSNLLVLDEPTNDLDLETLDLLQEILADYTGTLLLVSHDRDFLDRVVTSVIVWERPGIWQEYAGGYSDFVRQRGHGVEAKAQAATSRQTLAKPSGGAKPKGAAPRSKLSYQQKRALETLPGHIQALQNRIFTLEAALADPDLYSQSPEKFQRATSELAATKSELETAEDAWLNLELLREEVEGR